MDMNHLTNEQLANSVVNEWAEIKEHAVDPHIDSLPWVSDPERVGGGELYGRAAGFDALVREMAKRLKALQESK